VVRDAKAFQRARPGFASLVLLGVEFSKSDPADEDADSRGVYSYRAMTYERLIQRARFRLAYMLEGLQTSEAEAAARKILERQIDELVIDGSTPKRSPKGDTGPFARMERDDIERFRNAVPLYELSAAAGTSSPEIVVEVDEGATDELIWVAPNSRRKLKSGMFVAKVSGASMSRKIPDGSYCLFKHCTALPASGKIVLARLSDTSAEPGGRYLVKRVEVVDRDGADGGGRAELTLHSDADEPGFEPLHFQGQDLDQVRIVAELLEVLKA
jgi:hypothetical protein